MTTPATATRPVLTRAGLLRVAVAAGWLLCAGSTLYADTGLDSDEPNDAVIGTAHAGASGNPAGSPEGLRNEASLVWTH